MGSVILGAKTYAQFIEFGETYSGKKVYVISRKKPEKPNGSAIFYSGNLNKPVQKIKKENRRDISRGRV